MNDPRKLVATLLLVIFLSFSCIAFLIIFYYIDRIMLPIEPTVSGNFPKKPVWFYQDKDEVVSTLVSDDSLVILRTCCSIIALDAETGNELWRTDSISPHRIYRDELALAPRISRDFLIVPEDASIVAVYKISTGQLLWRTDQPEIELKAPGSAMVENFEIYDDLLFVIRNDWRLSAYNLLTGDLLWESPVKQKSTSDLEVDSDCVYVSESKVLRCYDPINGNIKWEKAFDNFIRPILLDKKNIFIAKYLDSSILLSMNIDTWNTNWAILKNEISDERIYKLELNRDILYAAGERLYAISTKNGSILWSSEELGLLEQPIPFNEYVMVRNVDKELYKLDADNGKVTGQMTLKANRLGTKDIDRSPTIINDLIVVPFGEGRVYAYRLK